MVDVTIEGRTVTLDDSFRNLTPEQQNETIEDIAAQLGISAPEPTPAGQGARQLVSGLTLGLGPEIYGGLEYARGQLGLGPEMSYSQAVARERARREQYRQENPIISPLAEGTGAAVTGMLAGGPVATGARTLAGQAGRLGALGGAEGLAYGTYGSSAETPQERLAEGLPMAAVGATLGAGIPLAIAGGQGAYRALRDMATAARPTSATAQRVADTRMARALARDEMTPGAVATEMQRLGPQAMPADVSPSVRGTLEVAANRPGPAGRIARQAFEERAAGQADRIVGMLDRSIGPVGSTPAKVTTPQQWDTILSQEIPLTPSLKSFMARPSMREAYKKASRMSQEMGQPAFPPLKTVLDPNTTGVELRVMQWIKENLDDVLEAKRDEVTRRISSTAGKRALQAAEGTRRDFRDEIKKLGAGYADILDTWSQQARISEAENLGTRALKLTASQIRRQMQGFTPEQRRAYRQGAVSNIRDRIAARANLDWDVSTQLLRDQHKLRRIFGENAEDLIKTLRAEREMAVVPRSVLENSATARRLAAQDEQGTASMTADLFTDALTGTPQGMAARALRSGKEFLMRPNEEVDRAIANLATSQDRQRMLQYLLNLQAAQPSATLTGTQGQIAGGLTSGLLAPR